MENLSHDPEEEYFADGMTEALITEFAQIRALRVTSRTSVMQYKRAQKTLPQIAKELDVAAVVEGSVQRSGDRVEINVQLIQASNDEHLWAKSYQRNLRDVLDLQREVARAIAGEIRVAVTPQEKEKLAQRRSVNPDAYQAYLKAVTTGINAVKPASSVAESTSNKPSKKIPLMPCAFRPGRRGGCLELVRL